MPVAMSWRVPASNFREVAGLIWIARSDAAAGCTPAPPQPSSNQTDAATAASSRTVHLLPDFGVIGFLPDVCIDSPSAPQSWPYRQNLLLRVLLLTSGAI